MRARGMRLLGDVLDDVVDQLGHKVLTKTYNNAGSELADHHRVPNDPRHEWMFAAVAGKDPAEQKRLILQARHPSAGFLTDADTDVLISTLGLEGA